MANETESWGAATESWLTCHCPLRDDRNNGHGESERQVQSRHLREAEDAELSS